MPARQLHARGVGAKFYEAFLVRAERVLRAGHSVVLDRCLRARGGAGGGRGAGRQGRRAVRGHLADVSKEVAQARSREPPGRCVGSTRRSSSASSTTTWARSRWHVIAERGTSRSAHDLSGPGRSALGTDAHGRSPRRRAEKQDQQQREPINGWRRPRRIDRILPLVAMPLVRRVVCHDGFSAVPERSSTVNRNRMYCPATRHRGIRYRVLSSARGGPRRGESPCVALLSRPLPLV